MSWQNQIQALPQQRLAILGVGSELKADDAAGMLLIERLQKALGEREGLLLIAGSTAPENFTGQIKQFAPTHLLLVDAASLDTEPGTIVTLDLDVIKEISLSTHMLPLPFMINYLIHECGCAVSLLGIQIQSTEMGQPMDQRVRAAVETLATQIIDHLNDVS